MKIVDEKPDPSVVKAVICRNCGVKIEYVPIDVKTLWEGHDYSGGAAGQEGFNCPKCERPVVLRAW